MSGLIKPTSLVIGSNPLDTQYDLTVTGTNWTTLRAVGIVYRTSNGAYRLKFNISGTYSDGPASGGLTISGITSVNTMQHVSVGTNQTSQPNNAYIGSLSNTIYWVTTGGIVGLRAFGDIELASKPSWATSVS